jgi:hypothetical protein
VRIAVNPSQWLDRSVAVLRMRNGTSQFPFRLALGDSLLCRGRPAVAATLHKAERHGAHKMTGRRVGCACIRPSPATWTCGPFATAAARTRLRLPRTTRPRIRSPWRAAEAPRHTPDNALQPTVAPGKNQPIRVLKRVDLRQSRRGLRDRRPSFSSGVAERGQLGSEPTRGERNNSIRAQLSQVRSDEAIGLQIDV